MGSRGVDGFAGWRCGFIFRRRTCFLAWGVSGWGWGGKSRLRLQEAGLNGSWLRPRHFMPCPSAVARDASVVPAVRPVWRCGVAQRGASGLALPGRGDGRSVKMAGRLGCSGNVASGQGRLWGIRGMCGMLAWPGGGRVSSSPCPYAGGFSGVRGWAGLWRQGSCRSCGVRAGSFFISLWF